MLIGPSAFLMILMRKTQTKQLEFQDVHIMFWRLLSFSYARSRSSKQPVSWSFPASQKQWEHIDTPNDSLSEYSLQQLNPLKHRFLPLFLLQSFPTLLKGKTTSIPPPPPLKKNKNSHVLPKRFGSTKTKRETPRFPSAKLQTIIFAGALAVGSSGHQSSLRFCSPPRSYWLRSSVSPKTSRDFVVAGEGAASLTKRYKKEGVYCHRFSLENFGFGMYVYNFG